MSTYKPSEFSTNELRALSEFGIDTRSPEFHAPDIIINQARTIAKQYDIESQNTPGYDANTLSKVNPELYLEKYVPSTYIDPWDFQNFDFSQFTQPNFNINLPSNNQGELLSNLNDIINQVVESGQSTSEIPSQIPEILTDAKPKLTPIQMLAYKTKSKRLWALAELPLDQIIEIYQSIYDNLYGVLMLQQRRENHGKNTKRQKRYMETY